MNAKQLTPCKFDPYNFLHNMPHKIDKVIPSTDYTRFVRGSEAFTVSETSVIERMPAYVFSGDGVHRLTDLVEYWQYQVCNVLRRDVERQAEDRLVRVATRKPLEDGHFYSSCFPLIVWQLVTEDIFKKVIGEVWLKYER